MRRAGILLHISSLPSPGPVGDIGPAAHRLVDWLARAGCTTWQVLPLNRVGPGFCPYASPSALASEPALISLEWLIRDGLLDPRPLPLPTAKVEVDGVNHWKRPLLREAADRLIARDPERVEEYARQNPWVTDWALFAELHEEVGEGWWSWENAGLRDRKKDAIKKELKRREAGVKRQIALQLIFDQQWEELRSYADRRGVQLIGDVPIFVMGDGCDTWVNRELFELNAEGRPSVVTGVPPDYFSPTGQLWGNPHYRWSAHEATGFAWWKLRLSRVLRHVHRARIDHFRGLAAAWTVPTTAQTAMEGYWTPGPGKALFDALGPLPLIAEDLGLITPDVHELRQHIGAPGMKVLQFAFGSDANHHFLPHNYPDPNWVCYTGTHDNDTAIGWYHSAPEPARHRYRVYAGRDGADVAWDLIRMAWASVANDAIAPMQDVMALGGEARMNVPGEAEGNWTWRMHDPPWWAASRLRELAWSYGRLHNED
ncbi:4-alpha-glucanotransferase [Myxococcota bacterium]|nr:4-alpha-glucanotransferase [Myxococcota bacterium]